jgi:poly(beta-D-mannuronate) lyase
MSRCFTIGWLAILVLLASSANADWSAGAGEEAAKAGVSVENFVSRRTVQVATVNELMTAVAEAQAGDLIEVADGDYYNPKVIRFEDKEGTSQAPVVIRAANRGRARIIGKGGFQIVGCAYVVVEGFALFHKDAAMACQMLDSHHCRFTRNHVRIEETIDSDDLERRLHWSVIGGEESHHNRIDHNLFEQKRNSGVMICTGGSRFESGHMATEYDRIDHNLFRDFHHGKGNGYETIRLGSSTFSHSSSFTIIENNLFERCNGEGEIISVKTCDNTIRHNTFRDCRGMLTLRNCHNCTVEGNFFFNDAGQERSAGIRFFGEGHVIINNYLQDLDESAIMIRTGDIERRQDPRWKYEQRDGNARNYGAYQRPENTLVAFNTIVNCSVAFELGEEGKRAERYPLPARNITIANNLVISNRERINWDKGMWENLTVEGNLFYSSQGDAKLGWRLPEGSYSLTNPALMQRDGFLQLSPTSAAVNAAAGRYVDVEHDIEGQSRGMNKDIGADELSTESARHAPLKDQDVGPNAK